MLYPSALGWLRTEGAKLERPLRQRILGLYRPPEWLPCWFFGLWYWLVARFAQVTVIIRHDGDADHVRTLLTRHRGRMLHDLSEMQCVAGKVPVGSLAALCTCNRVRRIWLDGEVRACLDTAVTSAGAVQVTGRYTGSGVTIAVVDTGIHPHPDLAGRITAFADFVGNRTRPYDDNGHGTHVAGCAAGSGAMSDGQFRGPAPAARLVGVKVLNKVGAGSMSSLLAGINWVIANRDRHLIQIMSLSLGAPAHGSCDDDPLCEAVTRAWQAGIVVVAAAGNDGPDAGSISSPGTNPRVITVGAMNDRNTGDRSDDGIAAFSSRGPTPEGHVKPDVLAPGVQIVSLRVPRSFIDKQQPGTRVGDWYAELSGTSMATPLVAGLIALLLEADPALSNEAVRLRIAATAQDWGLGANDQGAGYIDADRLIGG